MAIVTLADQKANLGIIDDADDTLIEAKLEAAQAHIEMVLGYAIEEEFVTAPADLAEAVRSLAAHFYENREASVVGVSVSEMPMSVADILRERRGYSFGGA